MNLTQLNASADQALNGGSGIQTVRPIARQPRLLTERGRMLILRRRRQNERGERRAKLWELYKNYGGAFGPTVSFSKLPLVFRKGTFTPVYTKKRLKERLKERLQDVQQKAAS